MNNQYNKYIQYIKLIVRHQIYSNQMFNKIIQLIHLIATQSHIQQNPLYNHSKLQAITFNQILIYSPTSLIIIPIFNPITIMRILVLKDMVLEVDVIDFINIFIKM